MLEESSIPRDVPKGHLAVYVGEDYKRFVIKITLLKHPLFKALLDRARDEYGLPLIPNSAFLVMKASSSMSFVC
ncbi:Indole-3-acetic acid-induced protein ARG7 [Hibiscus syriacus]|uniref:Indole-3-acetic acid-induced protein ARG7 n=1 Tax=Hibiscus syriacus TaxID=106335 RepID=A0A6A3BB41_HIBSY|nr:Indole-3-acetic acid-induced protein ARG7 [Hibiscus syriacus]